MFRAIDPAYVNSPCPLLSAELACDYLPRAFMWAPAHSAWISLRLNIDDFAAGDGALDQAGLEHALIACVDKGDRLHDSHPWGDPRLQQDSWRNRRLAIALRGWGDLVALRGSDPQQLSTLRAIEDLAQWCCDIVHCRSRELARQRRWCPALDEAGRVLQQSQRSLFWRSRWKKALSAVAVRHRNLTTMSPWDVFERERPADLRNIDLLPILRFADSLSYQCDVTIAHWNANDFKGFCHRLRAVAAAEKAQTCIAEQV